MINTTVKRTYTGSKLTVVIVIRASLLVAPVLVLLIINVSIDFIKKR
jgi:hypothetical protein